MAIKSFIKKPSNRQKRIIRTENALTAEFLRENFGLEPNLITRDKRDHIVAIVQNNREHKFEAYIVGNDKNGNAHLLTAGKLFFKRESETSLFIPSLKVVNRFKGSGVGTILLKVAENFAVQNGCEQLSLLSELGATKIKSAYLAANGTDTEDGPGLKYFTYPTGKEKAKYAGYFDKNLYFYFSNGFELIDDPSLAFDLRDNIPLVKRNLRQHDLEFGVRGKKYLFRPTDPRFRVTTMHIEMDYTTEDSVHFEGKDAENSFAPLQCGADEASLEKLKKFFCEAAATLSKSSGN